MASTNRFTSKPVSVLEKNDMGALGGTALVSNTETARKSVVGT